MPDVPGKQYRDGEYIVRQGEAGECMYFVQAGEVEVVRPSAGREVRLALLGAGEFFGEMALLERDVRSASVRSLGEAQVLALDKSSFLQQVEQDPSLGLRMLEKMSARMREVTERLGSMGGLLPDEVQSVQALGSTYPLGLDKDGILDKVRQEPQSVLRMLKDLSGRIRQMDDRLVNISSLRLDEVK
jgi:CRP-like cAMP-binding protein